MSAIDAKTAQTALDNVLAAGRAMLPKVDDYERFASDRNAAVAELSTVRAELAKAQNAVASARAELDAAKSQMQSIKDEMGWLLKDLARVRQEFDELERAKKRRG